MKSHPLMQFFEYAHLPARVQAVSTLFGELAKHIDETMPDNDQRTTALQKLLEAKDAGVRAMLYRDHDKNK